MENKDFYKKFCECKRNLMAIKADKSDLLLCVKYGGLCKLTKCLNIHNNMVKL